MGGGGGAELGPKQFIHIACQVGEAGDVLVLWLLKGRGVTPRPALGSGDVWWGGGGGGGGGVPSILFKASARGGEGVMVVRAVR